jgi:hypothetical protein
MRSAIERHAHPQQMIPELTRRRAERRFDVDHLITT